MADDPLDELLTFDDALQVLGTSRPTLYRLLSSGDIRGLKVGKQWRFRRADLNAYMERSPVATTSAPAAELESEREFFADRIGREIGPANREDMIVELVNDIIIDAVTRRASDIHIEAAVIDGAATTLVRFRIDGVLQEVRKMPSGIEDAVMAQIKSLADMNVGEKRLPQDGRFPVKHDGKSFDLRVSIIPVVSGEAATIRILDRSSVLIDLDKLGLMPDSLTQINRIIEQPNGFFVIAGPTGSGKTTTALSCLSILAQSERKVITVEDPVEFLLPYATQLNTNKRIGLTIPAAVRSIMRQDPDIILIGAMRDLETLQLALEASLTGHLVLTTIHASDAPSTISRMLNLGATGHVLSSSLTGVVAQRLARRICSNCRVEIEPSDYVQFDTWRRLADAGGFDLPSDAKLYKGNGCEHCNGRGYRGRIGIFEIIEMTELLATVITKGGDDDEIARAAAESGMRTLWADGLRKAAAGETTVEELHRVIYSPAM